MKMVIALLFFSFMASSCSEGGDAIAPNSTTIFLDNLVQETVAEEEIPGMIAAIMDSDGIRGIGAAGTRKKGASEPITIDDLMHLGSCTKAMTSTLLATLVEKGEITWETTLFEVFPELKGEIHEDYYAITLHQLVSHRAGVASNARNWRAFQDLEIKERRIALLKDNLSEPSQIAPGAYHYSNLAYLIAGSMAEKVTNTSWEQLLKERIFIPLGMDSAGFGIPGTIGTTEQPWGHFRSNGDWRPIQADNPEALGPAGTVHSTFSDWAKFIALQLSKGESGILSRSSLDFLIQPIGTYASGWAVVQRSWAQGTALSHSGSNTMWYVVVWVAPKLNRAFLVGTNSSDENSASVTDRVIKELIAFDQSQ